MGIDHLGVCSKPLPTLPFNSASMQATGQTGTTRLHFKRKTVSERLAGPAERIAEMQVMHIRGATGNVPVGPPAATLKVMLHVQNQLLLH